MVEVLHPSTMGGWPTASPFVQTQRLDSDNT